MSAEPIIPSVESAAAEVTKRYGKHIAALLAYGSRVFGQARAGSEYDFWVIVKEPTAFHADNADFYLTQLNRKSTPEEQARLNQAGPLFYAFNTETMKIKMAVIGEQTFADLCRDTWWSVKGRMQKPVRPIVMSPTVEAALAAARAEGLECGLGLVPKRFTMEQLLFHICSLSYKSEIRPEAKTAKIRSILASAGPQLEEIYRPLLAEVEFVEQDGDAFVDTRSKDDRKAARRGTLRALRRSKYSRKSFSWILRNFRSHGSPIRYIFMKVRGEFEKGLKRLFGKKG
jgi:Phosphatidate cytidylyltransferase, mitochondrial